MEIKKTYSDYERVAIEKPMAQLKDHQAALGWFMKMSPLERLLAITHLYQTRPDK